MEIINCISKVIVSSTILFPFESLQMANAKYILKMGDKKYTDNYRLASITSVVGKFLIYEAIMREKIVEHLDINKLSV